MYDLRVLELCILCAFNMGKSLDINRKSRIICGKME